MPERPTEDRRQQVVDTLSTHYANDLLDIDEFERRLELAEHASSDAELIHLLEGLPALGQSTALVPQGSTSLAPTSVVSQALVPRANVPERKSLVAIFSGLSRKDTWAVPKVCKVVSIFGGADLDLRQAQFGSGVTEMKIVAVMGGVHVIVPPGLAVEVEGTGILGAFDQDRSSTATPTAEGPSLRISGLAIMGGVEIEERRPGESRREARRRRKKDRQNKAP